MDKKEEEITAGEDLSKSHTYFFFGNIIHVTDKAFRIKVINRKGALTTVWVPRSRCKFETLLRRSNVEPYEMLEIRKYYAPNFFIK